MSDKHRWRNLEVITKRLGLCLTDESLAVYHLRHYTTRSNNTHQVSLTSATGLLSEADWVAIQETLYLLSIPGMRESIRAGLATPIEECETLEDSLTLRYRELEW